jgi:hypothetical protein
VQRNTKEQLAEARTVVTEATRSLVAATPEALDRCARLLQEAAEKVATCAPELDGKEEALAEARQLQAAIQRARVLLDAAFRFHFEWSRRLGVMSGGYTPEGEPATLDRGSRLAWRG